MRPGEPPTGSVTESYGDPIREAGSSTRLGPCPCLPTLSCANTREGGSSVRFPMPRKLPIPGQATPRRASLPPSLPPCTTVWSITLRHWRLMDGGEKLCSADMAQ